MRVDGIRRLQKPTVYIGAVVAAFILYYVDRYYGFNLLFSKAEHELENIKTNMKVDSLNEKSPIDNKWIFVFAVLFVTFLIAAKRVYDRRREQRLIESQEENSGAQVAEGREVCEKISQEQYDYQSSVLTRQEIHKLVNSEAYKRTV